VPAAGEPEDYEGADGAHEAGAEGLGDPVRDHAAEGVRSVARTLKACRGRSCADKVRGQKPAEYVAEGVGKKVRQMMHDTDGTRPKLLPLSGDIREVKKGLKQAHKEFKCLDKGKATRKK
jgi:hypothetical protein